MLTFGGEWPGGVCVHCALCSRVHCYCPAGPGPSLGLAPALPGLVQTSGSTKQDSHSSVSSSWQEDSGLALRHLQGSEGGDKITMARRIVRTQVTDHHCRDAGGESDMIWAPENVESVPRIGCGSEFSGVHSSMFIMHWTIDELLLLVTARLSRAASPAELVSVSCLAHNVYTQATLQGSFNRWAVATLEFKKLCWK